MAMHARRAIAGRPAHQRAAWQQRMSGGAAFRRNFLEVSVSPQFRTHVRLWIITERDAIAPGPGTWPVRPTNASSALRSCHSVPSGRWSDVRHMKTEGQGRQTRRGRAALRHAPPLRMKRPPISPPAAESAPSASPGWASRSQGDQLTSVPRGSNGCPAGQRSRGTSSSYPSPAMNDFSAVALLVAESARVESRRSARYAAGAERSAKPR